MTIERASSAILIRDGRYLLIRRRNPPSHDMFAFPGGRAEAGEAPDETALREFAEETGISARNPRLFAFYDLAAEQPGERHFHLSVFLVEAESDVEAEAADDAADAGWFTAEEVRRLPAPPSVIDCIDRLEAAIASGQIA